MNPLVLLNNNNKKKRKILEESLLKTEGKTHTPTQSCALKYQVQHIEREGWIQRENHPLKDIKTRTTMSLLHHQL